MSTNPTMLRITIQADGLSSRQLAERLISLLMSISTRRYDILARKALKEGFYNRIEKALLGFDDGEQKMVIFRRSKERQIAMKHGLVTFGTPIQNSFSIHSFLNEQNFRSFGVQKVLEYDIQCAKPYEMMEYVRGVALDEIYDKLPLSHKLAVAKCIVEAKVEMEGVRFGPVGRLVSAPGAPERVGFGDHDTPAKLTVVGVPVSCDVKKYQSRFEIRTSQPCFTVRDLVFRQLDAWEEAISKSNVENREEQKVLLERLRAVAEWMDGEGWFVKYNLRPNVLYHWDLFPRNIVVQVSRSTEFTDPEYQMPHEAFLPRGDTELVRIAAIIDWDGAMSLPDILTRSLPSWLWSGDYGASDEFRQHKLPSGDEAVIKRSYDETMERALPGYLEDAYGEEGLMIRHLIRFLILGVDPDVHGPLCKDLLAWYGERRLRASGIL